MNIHDLDYDFIIKSTQEVDKKFLSEVKKEIIKQVTNEFEHKSSWSGTTRFKFHKEKDNKLIFNTGSFLGITTDKLTFTLVPRGHNLLVKIEYETGRSAFDGVSKIREALIDFIELLPNTIIDSLNMKKGVGTEFQRQSKKEVMDENLTNIKSKEAALSAIDKLYSLYKKKIITKAEFETKKKDMLAKI